MRVLEGREEFLSCTLLGTLEDLTLPLCPLGPGCVDLTAQPVQWNEDSGLAAHSSLGYHVAWTGHSHSKSRCHGAGGGSLLCTEFCSTGCLRRL